MALRDRTNPLLFRRDGALDLAQVGLGALVGFSCLVVWCDAGSETFTVSLAAYAFLAVVVFVAFVAWAARDRAELLVASDLDANLGLFGGTTRDTSE